MKHCHYLDDGLVFDLDCIGPCCDGTKYLPPTVPYSGGDFPMKDVRRSREGAVRANQTATGPCQSCPSLREGVRRKKVGPFHYVTFDHFSRCNGRCRYCGTWRTEVREPAYALAGVVREMDAARMFCKDASFSWGGGEPTLLAEFDDLLGFLCSRGYRQFVNTNGIICSCVVVDALRGGLTDVQMSLDCGTRETYALMKGQDLFSVVESSIAGYAAASPSHLIVKYIVANANCGDADLDGFVRLCGDLGVRRVSVSPEANEAWGKAILPDTVRQTRKLIQSCRDAGLETVVREDLYGEEYTRQLGTEELRGTP